MYGLCTIFDNGLSLFFVFRLIYFINLMFSLIGRIKKIPWVPKKLELRVALEKEGTEKQKAKKLQEETLSRYAHAQKFHNNIFE